MRKTPSFKNYQPSSETSSRIKRANRPTDSKHEITLRRELWRIGLRYRKNVKALPGSPDIVFPKSKVTIFCDGDFWHGRDWGELRKKLERRANSSYWIAKIESNIKRDIRDTARLEELGWKVIRVWETDIQKNATEIANNIYIVVKARRLTG
jgi:DNA mismatch endonuclease, patch repair protein